MAMYNMSGVYPDQRLWEDNFTNFLFLSHNFGSRYARKPLKGSKDLEYTLDSKTTLGQKMAYWVGAQGQVKLVKKTQNHPHLRRHSHITPNAKRKSFVSILTRRLAKSVDGLNSSLAQSANELWRCKAWPKKQPACDLKDWVNSLCCMLYYGGATVESDIQARQID